jgi:ribonuclease BN (tRNA processing enzyme)
MKILSEETKRRISNSKKGGTPWNKGKKTGLVPRTAFKKGEAPWNKGRNDLPEHSIEHKKKVSEKLKGKIFSREYRDKLRLAAINYIKEVSGAVCPRIGHNEKQILDNLEIEMTYKILRQYEVDGYFLDGYIEELNLAIEVDERPKNKLKDIERENYIKDKLNCEFLRIKDYD